MWAPCWAPLLQSPESTGHYLQPGRRIQHHAVSSCLCLSYTTRLPHALTCSYLFSLDRPGLNSSSPPTARPSQLQLASFASPGARLSLPHPRTRRARLPTPLVHQPSTRPPCTALPQSNAPPWHRSTRTQGRPCRLPKCPKTAASPSSPSPAARPL